MNIITQQTDTTHRAKIEFHQDYDGLKRLMQQIKERDDEERRLTYVRIGLGIAFLAVLVIGLSRRRKRKSP